MVRHVSPAVASPGDPPLFRLQRGDILGLLPKGQAERGYHLYQDRRVVRITWTGDDLEAELSSPPCTVRVTGVPIEPGLDSVCTQCRNDDGLCAHALAALMQWLDIRPTMRRLGRGTMWRGNSRHPFLAPARGAAERVDLSHLTGGDLRSALELQLSLQRSGTATARLVGNAVEIQLTLPSGDRRVVSFSATVLPSVLPLLRSLPGVDLDGDLEGLELSQARLHPVLQARWEGDAIILEPGYRLSDGTVVPGEKLDGRIHGRWAQIGNLLCRVLDPATPLVPFFRRGRMALEGQEALRFLNLDHPQLGRHPWYLPDPQLASYRQPRIPKPRSFEAEYTPNGRIRLRVRYAVEDTILEWRDAVGLIDDGYLRVGDMVVRAPDLAAFERLGFKMPRRAHDQGLLGDRLAFIRVLAESGLEVVGGDDELVELGRVLSGAAVAPVEDPPGLRSRLRPYQRDGVGWLWRRYVARIGALLADDMGLGKTHQVMGLLCMVRDRRPDARCLVVCPRGVLDHWHTLLATFAPGLRVHRFHGPSRELGAALAGGVVVLTTYDIIFRSLDELSAHTWEVAVFDEAQRIKNPRTKAARAARRLPAAFRVALSGTPLENRLLELWSVIDLILPGYLGSERDFRLTYRNPSHAQLHRLRQRLSVLTLRRIKEQVLSDLPDKVEDLRYCHLSSEQEALYRRVSTVEGGPIAARLADPDSEIPYLHIFALLTRLKQICDHPALVDGGHPADPSGKLEVFDQILEEALDGDHRVVVFSQYVSMISLLSKTLERRGIGHLVLTGETRDRDRVVRRFNSEQHERVLLASLLAGGVGIDLTAASVVIHYDRWWNPARENQATDRVHRIGQKRFVQVFKLITRSTIEERIDRILHRKAALMDEVVAPTEEIVHRLDRSELAELLGVGLPTG